MRLIDGDALIAQIEKNICKPCKERKEDYNGVRCRACQYGDEIDDIEDAPTIEPEPRWTPVSERLPDMGFSVLVSAVQNDIPYVAEAVLEMDGTWSQMRWSAKLKAADVIAWMPLPEVWRGEEDA